jgi:hypothetical protein
MSSDPCNVSELEVIEGLEVLPRELMGRARRADPLSPIGQAARRLCALEPQDGALSLVEPGARGALSPAAGESGGVTQVE